MELAVEAPIKDFVYFKIHSVKVLALYFLYILLINLTNLPCIFSFKNKHLNLYSFCYDLHSVSLKSYHPILKTSDF